MPVFSTISAIVLPVSRRCVAHSSFPGSPKLAALAAASADGQLVLHVADHQPRELLGPLVTRLIKRSTSRRLYVTSPDPADVALLEANGFRWEDERMILHP